MRLFRRFMGRRRVYAIGFALLVVEAVTAVIEPYPIAYLIDYLQGARPDLRALGSPAFLSSARWGSILLLTLAIVLIAAVNSAADSLTEVCMARGGRSLGYNVRVAMYSHLQRLSLAYHDRRRTGDVLTRVTGDVLVLEDFVVKSVSNILGSLMVLLGSFAFLLYQSWKVTVIALVVVPLLAAVSNHYSRRIKVASRTQRDREGDLASTTQEMLTSIRLVQSYGRGTVDLAQFSDQTAKSMHASLGAANIQAQFSFVIALMEALSISAVVWLGVWLFDRGALTIGTLVLFVLLLQNMFKPARKIVSEWYKIGKVFASVDRIQDLLDRQVVVRDLPDAVPGPPMEGRLTFWHVSFAYPVEHEDGSKAVGRPKVLDDIDFEIAPGEVVALVGYSGAGKSTIAQLVPRLYDPDQGEILVDGHPLRRLTLASLRAQVSVVLQETVLLSGTVAENIGYGIAGATREDIEAAARMANAHDFIVALPEGYDTVLGERGSTLSGGQRQRLAIARAFIRRAPILILDEPTTGLDVESAQSVNSALRILMRGTTTIVISHDTGLVRCADRILVISDGRIVEEGRHETLLRTGGVYAELYGRDPAVGLSDVREPMPSHRVTTSRTQSVQKVTPLAPYTSSLVPPLQQHLPGLARALDLGFVASHIESMVGDDAAIRDIAVGKLWLRADGSCNLRYHLNLTDGSDPVTEATILGRVHSDATHAEAFLTHVQARGRDRAAVVPDAALSLCRFPFDPDLPTLAEAVDAQAISGLAAFARGKQPPTVAVVHHSRQGPCVLQYRFRRSPAHSLAHPAPIIYGKVYADGTGDVVHGFLRALALAREHDGDRHPAVFPTPVLYDPKLRLLLIEAVPGEPRVPRLLSTTLGITGEDTREGRMALQSAVRESGRALAVLHGGDLATAPVRSMTKELEGVRRELGIVASIWPQLADRVRSRLDLLSQQVPEAPDIVLSHGDFTPSQVVLGGRSPTVVDLDTLCWADPALDLGRYIAHLHLKALKVGGEKGAELVERLTAEFLDGYSCAGPRAAAAAAAMDRIAFYKSITLARTALRACRQLKPTRFGLAMSLLDDIHAGRVDL
ncbi:MAG: ABC transporter transmembrane domain-containing protein [Carbonactinosporaceae bacterium]